MGFVCEARLTSFHILDGAIILGEENTETGRLAPRISSMAHSPLNI